jgi:4-amino-4-deoxy-L-arabinose transferase-like glycosyltransferase
LKAETPLNPSIEQGETRAPLDLPVNGGKPGKSTWILLLLLAVGLALRLVLIHARPDGALEHAADEDEYLAIARSVAAGHGFALNGQLTAYRDMLFPTVAGLMMRVGADSPLVVLYLDALLGCATGFLVFLLGKKRFGEKVGLVMAGAWLLYTGAAIYAALFFTESLCVFLWVAALVLYDRLEDNGFHWGTALLIGIACGLAMLTRVAAMALPLSLIVYIAFIRFETAWRVRWRAAGLVIVGMAAIVLPWMARNAHVVGAFTLNTSGGINLFIGNNAQANGSYKFNPDQEALLPAQVGEAATSRAAQALALNYMREHSRETVKLWGRKFAFLWATDASQWIHYLWEGGWKSVAARLRQIPVWMLLFLAVPYMLLVGCGVSGYYLVRHFPTRGLFLLQAFFVHAAVFATFGTPRFHQLLMPALIVGGGALWRPRVWDSAPLWRRLFLLFTLGLFVGLWLFEASAIAGYAD